jgi:hypothetical protein
MQPHTFTGFSFGEIGGLVRRVLWERRVPTFLIPPGARFRTVACPKQEFYRQFPARWKMTDKDLEGDRKSQEDRIDACAYAVIAAFGYKLLRNQRLTLVPRLHEVYWNKRGSGLLDRMAGYRLEGLDGSINAGEGSGQAGPAVRTRSPVRPVEPAEA